MAQQTTTPVVCGNSCRSTILIDLDARPSDAINLAVRQNAPIYIEEDVLEKESYPFIIKKNHILNENDIEQFHTFIKTIEPEDFEEEKE